MGQKPTIIPRLKQQLLHRGKGRANCWVNQRKSGGVTPLPNLKCIFLCLSFLSCKLLKALFSPDAGGLAAETFQAPAAWHPNPDTAYKTVPFITSDVVPLLCQTQAIDYEGTAPLCCPGQTACRGELPAAGGTCASGRAGLRL